MGWAEKKLEEVAAGVAAEGERTRLELADALAQSVRGLRIDGALARPVRPNAVNYSAGGRLVGWSVRVRGGTVIVTLYDGRDASGDQIAALTMANNGEAVGSNQQWFGPGGVSFVDGLYVDVTVVTGAPVLGGAIYIGAVD